MRDCLRGRLLKLTLEADHTEATVTNGKDQGVGADWTATIDDPIRTRGQIWRIDRANTVVKFTLTPDVISQNPIVELCPP